MHLFPHTGFSIPGYSPSSSAQDSPLPPGSTDKEWTARSPAIISVLQVLFSAFLNFLFARLDLIPFSFLLQTPVPPTHPQTRISRSSDPSLLHSLRLP